jgi:hypothetical protein
MAPDSKGAAVADLVRHVTLSFFLNYMHFAVYQLSGFAIKLLV